MKEDTIQSIVEGKKQGANRVLRARRKGRATSSLARAGEFSLDALCHAILAQNDGVISAVFNGLSCVSRATESRASLLREPAISKGVGLLDSFALETLLFWVPCALLSSADSVLKSIDEAWLQPASREPGPSAAHLLVTTLRSMASQPGSAACGKLDEVLSPGEICEGAGKELLLFARGVTAAQSRQFAECRVVVRELARVRREALLAGTSNAFESDFGSILGERECSVVVLANRNGASFASDLFVDDFPWPRAWMVTRPVWTPRN